VRLKKKSVAFGGKKVGKRKGNAHPLVKKGVLPTPPKEFASLFYKKESLTTEGRNEGKKTLHSISPK